jgi:hypothetical protein
MSKRTDWRQRPIALGLLALAVMFAGWKISTYAPQSPRAAEQARTLDEVRALADDPALAEKLDALARHRPPPVAPYQVPGRLLLLGGLLLFVLAGVLMYRQPPRADEDEEGRVAPVPDEDGVPLESG